MSDDERIPPAAVCANGHADVQCPECREWHRIEGRADSLYCSTKCERVRASLLNEMSLILYKLHRRHATGSENVGLSYDDALAWLRRKGWKASILRSGLATALGDVEKTLKAVDRAKKVSGDDMRTEFTV